MPQDLIQRLSELIVEDKAILFVGADLRRELGEESPARRIADLLAAAIDYDERDRSLPAVAQAYQDLLGRERLIRAVGEALQGLDAQPTSLHGLVADAVLPSTSIITSWFDQVLETALQKRQKPFRPVVQDEDVTLVEEGQVTLVKLQGDIGRPGSLILTEEDLIDVLTKRPTVKVLVQFYLATKNLIFLGYDLNSDVFQRLYRDVSRELSAYLRASYAVTSLPVSPAKRRRWTGQGFEIHQVQDLVSFLGELDRAVKDRSAGQVQPPRVEAVEVGGRASVRLAGEARFAEVAWGEQPEHCRPYKALESYTAADAALFSGRREDSRQLALRILGRRLTLLYGESGSGKTSLLQAGVGPLLPKMANRRTLMALATPAGGQPFSARIEASLFAAAAAAGLGRSPAAETLSDQLRAWQTELDGPIVLALDQFEQFFLVYDDPQQAEALALLGALATDRTLDLRLVFVIREDFLGRMLPMEASLPGLFETRFRLERLGRQEAEAAIVEPAALCQVTWEPALVQTLLDTLYERAGGGVAPPQLQILCARLFDEVEGTGEERPLQITLAVYEALGGANGILGSYLDQAISQIPASRQEGARRLLAALVGSGRVKQRLGQDDLARAAELEPGQAAALLEELVRQRLVQRFQEGTKPSYELTHDVLVARIARWLEDDYDFWAGQKAREILRQALKDSSAEGVLLSPADADFVLGHAARLRLNASEQALVYASAVAYGDGAQAWAERLNAEARSETLLQLLANPQPFVRRAGAQELALTWDGNPRPGLELARRAVLDSDEGVREAAALALAEGIEPVSGAHAGFDWLTALALPLSASGTALKEPAPDIDQEAAVAPALQQERALTALVLIRDREPASRLMLPPTLRSRVHVRLRRLRWRRSSEEVLTITLRAAQGGFWGLGLGFGLLLGPLDVFASGLDQLSLDLATLISFMALGFPLAGLIGAVSAGGGTLAAETARVLFDMPRPRWHWLAVTAIIAGLMGLLFWPLALILAGDKEPLPKIAAGLIVGIGLALPALMPLRGPKALRLIVAAVFGVAAFMLIASSGLMLDRVIRIGPWWLFVVGITSGIGFFLGLDGSMMKAPALAHDGED